MKRKRAANFIFDGLPWGYYLQGCDPPGWRRSGWVGWFDGPTFAKSYVLGPGKPLRKVVTYVTKAREVGHR